MKTDKTILCSFLYLFWLVAVIGCTEQPYYAIPTNANGKAIITGVASAASDGITVIDDQFTVSATFPNAKEGDIMKVELLKMQPHPEAGNEQLLPLAGTQKEVTVGSDLKASVTYTRTEANMNAPGDFVTVTFGGKTDAIQLRVDMTRAMTIEGPEFENKEITLVRTPETAFFEVNVQPKLNVFTGSVIVKRKNGTNAAWENVGSGPFTSPAMVPLSGDDFAPGKDTVYYSFVARQGSFADSSTVQVIVSDPFFFFKKVGTLSLVNSAQGGMDIIGGRSVLADDVNAILSVSNGSLIIKGGSAWAVNGKSIAFVASTPAMYNNNNSSDAISAYEGSTPTTEADHSSGDGIFIFKIVNGPDPSDIFYGMIKVTKVVPGTSVDYEYRIGNVYKHLSIIK